MIHWRELLFISLFLRYYSVTIADIFAVANNSPEQELQYLFMAFSSFSEKQVPLREFRTVFFSQFLE